MANEITASITLSVINGNASFSRKVSGQKFDQAASGGAGTQQEIGFAAHEAIDIGDVGTEGWCYFRNLDDTNFVEIGVDVAAAFKPMIRLEPGEFTVFRASPVAGATLYAQADTAAVQLEYHISED